GKVQPVITNKVSHHVLSINSNYIYIVKSQMGAGGVGGATLTIQEAIAELNPTLAIMGGIAFGGNRDDQEIGNVLIATKIWEYEPEKIKENGTIPRGAIIPSSPRLVQMFETVAASVTEIESIFGMIASGEKLVNKKGFVQNKLKRREPELIGGEMEGAGFAAACQRYDTPWILVKGICDWGYEKDTATKKADQVKAAKNTFLLIRKVISHCTKFYGKGNIYQT
ncbi:MAG: hypothetical protein FWE42_09840, partial [Defluviitaleaceae bacterium]|nr:hypothetical protein [Defluviitaleaceae bacterium]